jgi:hypothetical protein
LILSISTSGFAQSPWPQPEKKLLTQLSFNIIPTYNELYVNQAESYVTERKLQDMTLQGWFEYGLSSKTAFLMILPIKILEAGELSADQGTTPFTSVGSLRAFSNIRFAWKQKWFGQAWIVSSILQLELPTTQYKDESGLRSGYDAWGGSFSLSTGRGFGNAYMFGFLGVGTRSNDYSDYITGGLEVGYRLFSQLWLAGVFDLLQSLQNGSREDPLNNQLTGLYLNDQEYLAWGLKIFGEIIPEQLGYSAALFGAFSGNFVAKSPTLNLGLFYRFSL